jgi:hypothetical protein
VKSVAFFVSLHQISSKRHYFENDYTIHSPINPDTAHPGTAQTIAVVIAKT